MSTLHALANLTARMVCKKSARFRRWSIGAPMVAAFLCLLPLPASAEPLERAAKATPVAARSHFQAGEELYRSGRYEEALSAFQLSYALAASPGARWMSARCLRELGRLPEAFSEFKLTVHEADAAGDFETRSAAHTELQALKSKVSFVVVETEEGLSTAEFRLGERRFSSEALGQPIPVVAGIVTLSVRIDGQEREQTVTVRLGATSRVLITAPPTPRSKARLRGRPGAKKSPAPTRTAPFPLRTAAFIAGGTGVASGIAFGILGPMSSARYRKLKSSCPAERCSAGQQAELVANQRLETLAHVGLALSVLGVGTGVALYLAAPRQKEQSSVTAVIGPGSVKLEGSF